MGKAAEEVWGWLKQQLGDKAVLLIAFTAFVGFGVAWARSNMRDMVQDEMAPTQRQVDEHERRMAHYEEDVHEFAKDVRELYRVTPHDYSDRLEKPFPGHDGGER